MNHLLDIILMAFDSLFQATPKFDSPSLPRDYENTNQFQSKQRLFFSEKAGDKQKKKTKRFGAKRRISNPGNNDRKLLQYHHCANVVRHVKFTIAAAGLKILVHFPVRF